MKDKKNIIIILGEYRDIFFYDQDKFLNFLRNYPTKGDACYFYRGNQEDYQFHSNTHLRFEAIKGSRLTGMMLHPLNDTVN